MIRTLRVLVVEDHEDTATCCALLLRLYGYEVDIAPDGPTALRAVQVNQPDVVLLDLGLPGMDGWQVAKKIRELTAPKRPFVVAITGYGLPADRLRSELAGIDLNLLKPVDMVDLDKLLRRFQEVILPSVTAAC
jgi:CheY-like chemotaxis protein